MRAASGTLEQELERSREQIHRTRRLHALRTIPELTRGDRKSQFHDFIGELT
jgi:hypothetical protein